MNRQLAFFEDVKVDPPQLPAGPAPSYVTPHHAEAMRNPKPGFERALVSLLRGFAEYAQAQAATGCIVSEDGYISGEWDKAILHTTAFLNQDHGRLDGGELSRQFEALRLGGGDELSVREVLDATAETSAPTNARLSSRVTNKPLRVAKVYEVPIGTKFLDERQRELLRLVRVENNLAVYTGTEQIPDWAALKSVMLALGGKWKTKSGFIFPDDLDAAELVRLALETGEILDAKEAEFFETNEELANQLAFWVQPKADDVVLEPSAGRGAIVRAILRQQPGALIRCIEPLPAHVNELRLLHGVSVIGSDFAREWTTLENAFDGVAMNPPFSKRQDIKHITWAISCLKLGGRLAAIASAGVLYRDDSLGREFRELVHSHGGTIVKNPENSFAMVGTKVSTVMVRLEKRR